MSQSPAPVRFETDVKPMFRELDRESMLRAFDLWSVDDVRTHAAPILEAVRTGRMPCDGPWTEDRVDVFRRWMDTGMAS